jgi:hypothetical protein
VRPVPKRTITSLEGDEEAAEALRVEIRNWTAAAERLEAKAGKETLSDELARLMFKVNVPLKIKEQDAAWDRSGNGSMLPAHRRLLNGPPLASRLGPLKPTRRPGERRVAWHDCHWQGEAGAQATARGVAEAATEEDHRKARREGRPKDGGAAAGAGLAGPSGKDQSVHPDPPSATRGEIGYRD